MKYIVRSVVEEDRYRDADRLLLSLKSTRRQLRAERRKGRRPKVL